MSVVCVLGVLVGVLVASTGCRGTDAGPMVPVSQLADAAVLVPQVPGADAGPVLTRGGDSGAPGVSPSVAQRTYRVQEGGSAIDAVTALVAAARARGVHWETITCSPLHLVGVERLGGLTVVDEVAYRDGESTFLVTAASNPDSSNSVFVTRTTAVLGDCPPAEAGPIASAAGFS